jgi:cbb3-type cytochrome oxidase subunit 3
MENLLYIAIGMLFVGLLFFAYRKIFKKRGSWLKSLTAPLPSDPATDDGDEDYGDFMCFTFSDGSPCACSGSIRAKGTSSAKTKLPESKS